MTIFSDPSPGIYAGDAAAGLAISAIETYLDRSEAVLDTRASLLIEEPMQPDSTTEPHVARQTITFKFRLRDRHAAELNRQARSVSYVWNFCNETQQKATRAKRKEGGSLTADKMSNRDLKEANREREGGKDHLGGLKTGGRAKRMMGGPLGANVMPRIAPGGSPGMVQPGMMPRKSGGRAYLDMEYGAGGGKGRLEKIKAYGDKLRRD